MNLIDEARTPAREASAVGVERGLDLREHLVKCVKFDVAPRFKVLTRYSTSGSTPDKTPRFEVMTLSYCSLQHDRANTR